MYTCTGHTLHVHVHLYMSYLNEHVNLLILYYTLYSDTEYPFGTCSLSISTDELKVCYTVDMYMNINECVCEITYTILYMGVTRK